MKIAKGFLLTCLLGLVGSMSAQDVHFTMFDMAPLRLNPAQTGFYEGSFRVGGIYRTQWQSLNVNGFNGSLEGRFGGYQTPHAYIDLPFAFPKSGSTNIRHWAGIGLSFTSDKVSELSQTNAMLSFAYHLGLGRSGNTRISLGLSGGIANARLDASGLFFGDGINNGGGIDTYVPSADNSTQGSASFADFSGGINFAHRTSRLGIQAGFAVNHFTQPKYNFLGEEARLPMAMLGSLRMDIALASRWTLRPLAFYHRISNAQELNAQVLFGYHFNDLKDVTLLFGGGYRIGDAALMRVGVEIKGFQFGFAYDLNANGLSLSNTGRPMGFEFGISYIAKIFKQPVIKEILFCPRF